MSFSSITSTARAATYATGSSSISLQLGSIRSCDLIDNPPPDEVDSSQSLAPHAHRPILTDITNELVNGLAEEQELAVISGPDVPPRSPHVPKTRTPWPVGTEPRSWRNANCSMAKGGFREDISSVGVDFDDVELEDGFPSEVSSRLFSTSYPRLSEPTLTLGPFLFLEELPSGSCGKAYVARDLSVSRKSFNSLICLKVLSKDELVEKGRLIDAMKELSAYQQISAYSGHSESPFLMNAAGVLQDEFNIYFAMELMQSDLLAMLDNDLAFCRANAKRWIAQAALGIATLHEMGIIHRDIKPENILIDPRGNIRIADYGSSYVARGPLNKNCAYAEGVIGTWEYMAPEVVRDAKRGVLYGPAVDYWALGCVAYDLESEDHAALFFSREELERYISWRRADHGGQSYLSFAGLGEEAECLISGLLRRYAEHRYTFEEICRHCYFRDKQGRNTFWALADSEAASRRPIKFIMDCQDTASMDPSSIANPWLRSPHPPFKSSFDQFGWVNPNGIWARYL